MKQPDLFGGETEVIEGATKGWLEVKRLRCYGLARHKNVSCKTCKYLIKKDFHNKRYYKCELMSEANTATSDVRLKNVCSRWQPDSMLCIYCREEVSVKEGYCEDCAKEYDEHISLIKIPTDE